MINRFERKESTNDIYKAFVTPNSLTALEAIDTGLKNGEGMLFKFVGNNPKVVDFIEPFISSDFDRANIEMYNAPHSTEIYRDFLNWLFATFEESEEIFRKRLIEYLRLSKGDKVLITGCGLGDDISIISELIGPNGEIHAQDISKAMVLEAAQKNTHTHVIFSISNGNELPYLSKYFDAVFHFGGINLFGDMKKAVAELERVCKVGGRVVFGDESIAAHLRGTEYANVAINNNKLWSADTPIELLPYNALDIQLNYVLGNCFYVIGFTPGSGFPFMNIDVPHKGIRGGNARTRYYGQLEGVTEVTKNKVFEKAKELNISVHSLLEKIISSSL